MKPAGAPAVSVLMPTRDRARTLPASIESVLKQTFADLELLVVDDGSRDETRQVLARFTDPRVQVLDGARRGLACALNTGLAAARGRYVIQMDSDDTWLPELLASQVAILEAHPDSGLVWARGRVLDADGAPTDEVWGGPLRWPEDPLGSLLYSDPVCNITALKRRACFERTGCYDPAADPSSDWDLHLRIARHYPVRFNDAVLAHIGRYGDNITGRLDEFHASRIRVLDKLFGSPDLPAPQRALRPLAYSNVHAEHGFHRWSGGDYRRALPLFREALSVSDARARTAARILWFTAGRPLVRLRARRRSRALDARAGVS